MTNGKLELANVARADLACVKTPQICSTTVPAKCKEPAASQLVEPEPGGAWGCRLCPFHHPWDGASQRGCSWWQLRSDVPWSQAGPAILTLFVELMLFPLFLLVVFKKPLSSSVLPSANSALNTLERVYSSSPSVCWCRDRQDYFWIPSPIASSAELSVRPGRQLWAFFHHQPAASITFSPEPTRMAGVNGWCSCNAC